MRRRRFLQVLGAGVLILTLPVLVMAVADRIVSIRKGYRRSIQFPDGTGKFRQEPSVTMLPGERIIVQPVGWVEPTPVPTPTPTPTPTPPPTGAVFTADAETGDVTQWCRVHSAVTVGVVTSPVRAGQYAYKSEIRDGQLIYNTERSEYANGPNGCDDWHRFVVNTETWTAGSYYFPADFPRYPSWSLIMQWKEPDGGTPPQQVSLIDDTLSIVGVGSISPRPKYVFGTLTRGRWIDFIVHHYWSPDASKGFVEVHMDGALVLPKKMLKTMENNNPLFLNVGHYRDTANQGTAVLYVDEVRVGPTRASVELP